MILKFNLKRIISWFFVLIWMSVIFQFSSQQAAVSQKTSGGFTEKLAAVFVKDYKKLPVEKQESILNTMSAFVRKGAHLTEYAILGTLVYLAIRLYRLSTKKKTLFSVILSLFYSISDEIHQAFVPGRACRITDVLIDFIGICIGVFFAFIIIAKLKKKLSK